MLIRPDELTRFCEVFAAGRFWESHEWLEAGWREEPTALRHGLILYASAYVHLLRNNAHGVLAQLDKARRQLDGLPSTCDGVDIAALRAQIDRLEEEVTRRSAEGGTDLAGLAREAVIPLSRT